MAAGPATIAVEDIKSVNADYTVEIVSDQCILSV